MNSATVIGARKRRHGILEVTFDQGFALGLSTQVAAEFGLHVGRTLTYPEIERLKSADGLHRSLDSAMRYLGTRPRSEAEIRQRLARRGFDNDVVDQSIAKLKEQRLVDDASFAQYWRENRESFKPLSRRLIGLELRRKGVDAATVAEATADVDDELAAYRAAKKRARLLAGDDYSSFRKRLGAFLQRRGFDYELIARTVDRVWQEQVNQSQTSRKERS